MTFKGNGDYVGPGGYGFGRPKVGMDNQNAAKKEGTKPRLGNEGIRPAVKRSDRPTPTASDGKR